MKRYFPILALAGLIVSYSAAGTAPPAVHGQVTTADGKPASGAILTLTEAASGIEHSVFADADGRYQFGFAGGAGWRIRAQRPGADPVSQVLPANAGTSETNLTLAMQSQPALAATSEQWLALLPDGDMRREFIVNCATCHSIAASRVLVDGKPRDKASWLAAIKMMRAMDAYENIPADFDDDAYAQWLATAWSPATIGNVASAQPIEAALAAKVEITEYPYPSQTELPHDLAIAPDGRVWVTGFFEGDMLVLDPATGKTKRFPVNGGKPGGDVRALKFAADGGLWVVLGGTKSLVRLDVKTGKTKTFPAKMYAHDVELDSKGRPWLNDYFGKPERVARLDPASGTLTEYVIAAPQLTKMQGKPLPYGLQIDRNDILWGSQLAANTLFRLDPASGKSEVFPMPAGNSGPRRLALGKDGAIWIPEWNTGYLTSFDPGTRSFKRHQIGSPTIGAYDAEVDPRSGVVWITGSLASTIIRFDPATGRVDTIPLPTDPAFMRHITVDAKNGDVWATYSQLPASTPKIVRIRFSD
jgi:virginiamycin B lyase